MAVERLLSPDGTWWWDGTVWQPTEVDRPRQRARYVLPALVSVLTGLAIWIPTMALQPRYSFGPRDSTRGTLYLVLMVVAPAVLAIVFSTRWQPIAPGLVIPQLLLAPFTTPRGDDDGLWILIFPMLVFGLCALYLLVYLVASATRSLRSPRSPSGV